MDDSIALAAAKAELRTHKAALLQALAALAAAYATEHYTEVARRELIGRTVANIERVLHARQQG